MPSRMEKYYKVNTNVKQRSKLNEDLYRRMYDESEYSNIEGITNIERTDEIDILKIKQLLNSHKNQDRERRIIKETNVITETNIEEEEKSYDIRDILNKAKGERINNIDDYRSLRNTQYNILKGLKLSDNKYKEEIETEEELKELINTITSTSMLNKLGSNESSEDFLDELKSNNTATMIGNSKSIKAIIEEEKQKQNRNEEEELDRSFYTSSLGLNEDDFDDLKDINDSLKKNNLLIKILLFLLLIVIIVSTGYIIYNFIQ